MDLSIVPLALSAGTDSDFELFGQVVLRTALGIDFEPTGGMHDGGQDGFLRPVAGRPGHYVQISRQQTYKAKITRTITRLQESRRNVAALTYVTSLHLPEKDIIEAELERSTRVAIRIRDERWLTTTIAANPELEVAFNDRYGSVLRSIRSATEHIQKRYATTERMSVFELSGVGRGIAQVEIDAASIIGRNVSFSIIVTLPNYCDEFVLFPFGVEFRRDDLCFGACASRALVRLLCILLVANQDNLGHMAIRDHGFHEGVSIVARFQIPLIEDDIYTLANKLFGKR